MARDARHRVLGDGEDDRDDGEAQGESDHDAVARIVPQAEDLYDPLGEVAPEGELLEDGPFSWSQWS